MGKATHGHCNAGLKGSAARQQLQSKSAPGSSADLAASRAWESLAAVSHAASSSTPPLPAPRVPQAVPQHDPGFLKQLVAAQKKVRAAWSPSDDRRSDDEEEPPSVTKDTADLTDAVVDGEWLPDSKQGESSSLAAPAGAAWSSQALHAAAPAAAPPAKQLVPSDKPCSGAGPLSTQSDDAGQSRGGSGTVPSHSQQARGGPAAHRLCNQGFPDAARKRKASQATDEVTPLLCCTRLEA